MSRLPPVPPASKPVHGPDGVAKTSVDISHRVRHRAEAAARSEASARRVGRPGPGNPDFAWALLAAVAALALGFFAGRRAV